MTSVLVVSIVFFLVFMALWSLGHRVTQLEKSVRSFVKTDREEGAKTPDPTASVRSTEGGSAATDPIVFPYQHRSVTAVSPTVQYSEAPRVSLSNDYDAWSTTQHFTPGDSYDYSPVSIPDPDEEKSREELRLKQQILKKSR